MKEPPTLEELAALAAAGGIAVQALLNPRSKAVRESGADLEKITSPEAAALVRKNPRVLYRPLLTDGERLVRGFLPEEMEILLKKS